LAALYSCGSNNPNRVRMYSLVRSQNITVSWRRSATVSLATSKLYTRAVLPPAIFYLGRAESHLPEQFLQEARASLPAFATEAAGDIFASVCLQRIRLRHDQQVPPSLARDAPECSLD
jgi:hypothetical protein